MGRRENEYQLDLVEKLQELFPDAIVLKNDPNYIQGIPDLLILLGDRWAALECKRGISAEHQPNQDYYVELMNEMSFATFIYPENEERVFNELQQALRAGR